VTLSARPAPAPPSVAAAGEAAARGRRAEDARGRRGELIRAASSVLGRRGYADTSLKQIAREAGVAQGLLHYYFESKEDLLVAVVEELDDELTETWKRAVGGIEDPLERIVAGLDAAQAQCAQRPDFWRLLFDLYVLSLANPAIRRVCQVLRGRFIDDIEAEVRQVLGRLPAYSVVPPGDLAAAIAAAVEGIAMAALLEGRDPSAHFSALKVMLLSLVVTSYVTAGQAPPLTRLRELVRPRR
jgi:AcrR family transcriptional regulator